MVKMSIRESMAPGTSLMEKFENLRKLGFDGIELTRTCLPEDVPDIRKAMNATGIQPNITSAPGVSLVDARREERQKALEALTIAIEVAGEIGAVGVLSAPLISLKMGQPEPRPRIPDLWPVASTEQMERQILAELYGRVARRGEQVGAFVVIEPLNRYEQWYPKTLADAISICKSTGSQNCKIMADFFHMNIEEADIAHSIREAGKYIVNVHLADSQRLTPGHGHTDFKPGFAALKEVEYSYYLGLECGVPGEDKAAELQRTANYVRELYENA